MDKFIKIRFFALLFLKVEYNMNYTNLDDAYKIHHTNSTTYSGTICYSSTCIFCNNPKSTSLMSCNGDGVSFRRCDKCKKNFRANVLNNAVSNFSYSTHHLKGTN